MSDGTYVMELELFPLKDGKPVDFLLLFDELSVFMQKRRMRLQSVKTRYND